MKGMERQLLEALEKMESRDTVSQGSEVLHRMVEELDPNSFGELSWLLRTLFSSRATPTSVWARREHLFLLPAIARHFGAGALTPLVLKDKLLPVLLTALERASDVGTAAGTTSCARDLQAQTQVVDYVGRVFCDLANELALAVGSGGAEYLQKVAQVLVNTLLQPLDPCSGWDMAVKRRCGVVLSTLLPVLLGKLPPSGEDHVLDDFLTEATLRLMQGIVALPSAQEGILQCLAQLACARPAAFLGSGGAVTRRLADFCTAHLLRTPSAAPSYSAEAVEAAEAVVGRPSSPMRTGELTRELALMCCLCLRHLAEDVAPLLSDGADFASEHREVVLSALARDNLNLQRLVRSNELLRQAIARAWRAWSLDAPPRRADSAHPEAPSRPHAYEMRKANSMGRLTGPLLREPISDLRPQHRCLSPGAHKTRLPSPALGPEATRLPRSRPLQQRAHAARGRCPRPHECRGSPATASSARAAPAPEEEEERLNGAPQRPTSASSSSGSRREQVPALAAADVGPPAVGGEALPSARASVAAGAGSAGARHLAAVAADAAAAVARGGAEPSDCRLSSASPASLPPHADGSTQTLAAASGQGSATQASVGAGRLPPQVRPNAAQPSEVPKGAAAEPPAATNPGGRLPPPTRGAVPCTAEGAAPCRSAPIPAMREGAGAAPSGPSCSGGSARPASAARGSHISGSDAAPEVADLANSPRDHVATALQWAAAGHVVEAFRTVFRLGNEASLLTLLGSLVRRQAWSRLPVTEARYLARILVRLACKESKLRSQLAVGRPPSSAAEVCAWLAELGAVAGGTALLAHEDLLDLRSALFSLSALPGHAGQAAASAYQGLFEQPNEPEPGWAFEHGCGPSLRSGSSFGGLVPTAVNCPLLCDFMGS